MFPKEQGIVNTLHAILQDIPTRVSVVIYVQDDTYKKISRMTFEEHPYLGENTGIDDTSVFDFLLTCVERASPQSTLIIVSDGFDTQTYSKSASYVRYAIEKAKRDKGMQFIYLAERGEWENDAKLDAYNFGLQDEAIIECDSFEEDTMSNARSSVRSSIERLIMMNQENGYQPSFMDSNPAGVCSTGVCLCSCGKYPRNPYFYDGQCDECHTCVICTYYCHDDPFHQVGHPCNACLFPPQHESQMC